MTTPRILSFPPRGLHEHLRDELARNPFLRTPPIALEAQVRVRDGGAWLTGIVADHRGAEYLVRLPDSRALAVSAPALERDNPDPPRTRI